MENARLASLASPINQKPINLNHGINYLFHHRLYYPRFMMDANQLGRRNLSPDQRSIVRGRRYNRTKKSVGKPEGTILGQIDPISTAAKLATQHGVSFTRRNTLTNRTAFRINPDAVMGMARNSHARKPVRIYHYSTR
jgi:hypothetical protein